MRPDLSFTKVPLEVGKEREKDMKKILRILVALLTAAILLVPVGAELTGPVRPGTVEVEARSKKKKKKKNTQSKAESTVQSTETAAADGSGELTVEEDGEYTGKEEVALYIHLYGHLPDNYITKREAEDLGWVSREGNLYEVAPGKSIGGSRFGNYEGQLPEKNGRKYYECDIDFDGTYRNAKRIIYSNDGLVYYTEDHYKTFERLY